MEEILLNGLTTIVSVCFIAYCPYWLRRRDKIGDNDNSHT